MLYDSEYESIATIAVNKLVMMPTTYLAEKGFSALVDIKNKKRNRLKMVDAWSFGRANFASNWKKIAKQIDVPSSSSAN